MVGGGGRGLRSDTGEFRESVAGSAERAGPGAGTAHAARGVRLRRPVGKRVTDRGQVAACPGPPVVGRRAGSTRQGLEPFLQTPRGFDIEPGPRPTGNRSSPPPALPSPAP